MSIYVVDVSGYNVDVNWKALKAKGITGAIVKIIRKDLNPDKEFYKNVKALNDLGMPWGVYNYTYATTEAKAKSDAKLYCDMLDEVDKKNMKFGVWMDIEDAVQKKLSKAQNASIVNAAQETVESRGYTFGVYTGMSFSKEYLDASIINTKNWWIARYYLDKTPFKYCQAPNEKYKPTLPKNIIGWQYTSHCKTEGLMTGASGFCDQNVIYELPTPPAAKMVEEPKTVTVMVGSARIDENGNTHGGALGDQTGNEVGTQNWYLHSKGWYVLRPKDKAVAEKIAQAMEWACANNNIGYDQYNRNSLYNDVATKGFRTDKAGKCETDCSALVRVCAAYAGILVKDFNTSNEKSTLMATGKFDLLTDSQSKSQDYMKRGDILVTKTKGHTVVVLNDGNKASTVQNQATTTVSAKKNYTGTYPSLPPRGYFKEGDGTSTLKDYPTQIKRVQALVNWINGGKIAVDGHYGAKTVAAVKAAQKILKVTADGKFGKATLTAAKAYKK